MTLRASAMDEFGPFEPRGIVADRNVGGDIHCLGLMWCAGGCGGAVEIADRFCDECGRIHHEMETRRLLEHRAARTGEKFFALDRVQAGVMEIPAEPMRVERLRLADEIPEASALPDILANAWFSASWMQRAQVCAGILAVSGICAAVLFAMLLGAKVATAWILGHG